MSQQPPIVGADRLIFIIKSAYWVALLIIAAMVMASYMLLQQMMGEQQNDQALLSLVSTQKALSQRVVFLANAADDADERDKPQLIASLKKATAEFEKNYDQLLDSTGADAASPARNDATSIENVLFAKPFHLDYFSMGLAANGWRFISAVETELGSNKSGAGYLAGKERAQLDETVAHATLAGYSELGAAHRRGRHATIARDAQRPQDAVLRDHRRHHHGSLVHLPADVRDDPAPHARAGRCAQLDGLHRRA